MHHCEDRHQFRFLLTLCLTVLLLALSFPIRANGQSEGTRTPLSHVVFVMMENHSFDNIFGVYPTLNETTNVSSTVSQIQRPTNLLNLANPPPLSKVPNGTFYTQNPHEGYSTYHSDWDNGLMDGFAQHSGTQSMTYFTSAQFALEWDLAQEYALGDRYFASSLTTTDPNRLISLAGQSPITKNTGPPPYLPLNSSIFWQLSSSGVSWSYYVDNPSHDWFPLNYFSGIDQYSQNIGSWSNFFSSLSSGALPSVSWVMPIGGDASSVSQHPTENVTTGELWLANIVNSVMQSLVWNSTAIFINYDEGGGYYDQVPPPTVDDNQLGFRVPLIVISPYAKENYVSSTVLNHASTLAFIEYNWKLPALNGFVASSNLPLDFFDFNASYPGGQLIRAPLVLSPSAGFPQPFQIPVTQLPYPRSGSSAVSLGASITSSTSFSSTNPSSTGAQSTTSSQAAGSLSIFAIGTTIAAAAIAILVATFVASIRRKRSALGR